MSATHREPTLVAQPERPYSNTLPHVLDGEGYLVNGRRVRGPDDACRDVKDAVVTLEGHRCRRCRATEDLEVDHIKPLHQGGERTYANRQVLCHECHRLKTYYEGWIRAKPASRLLAPLLPQATGPYYYVVTGVWNATRGRWEQYGPFLSYEEAWEWVESRWLNSPKA